jgi:phage pi2 protein 07
MAIISSSNYRIGKEYVLGIDGKPVNVTIAEKGHLQMLLSINGNKEWYDNARLTPSKQLKKIATTDTFLKKVITENKPTVKPAVVAKPAVVKKLKVNHDALVPANKHTNEKWSNIHKNVMNHLRDVLLNHGYEKVYNLKPSELIALVDKNISDYVE